MFYKAIGIMSGTSLDGVDIVLCDFYKKNEVLSFKLIAAETIIFTKSLSKSLENARKLKALDLHLLDLELGGFIGEQVLSFLKKNSIAASNIHFIASHGHTIFHQPEKRVTCQIGNGQEVARITGIATVCNFREKDVLYGGQGAPLVPIGDRDLFSTLYDVDAFINLGGFANITYFAQNKIKAFDIGPCNLVLNRYAKLLGHSFDRAGALGRIAKIKHPHLVNTLNELPYFNQHEPKSLGVEWLYNEFYTLLDLDELSAQDKLGICYEVISDQIAHVLNNRKINKALLTGGGAKNDYLLELIRQKCTSLILVPEEEIIDFKEAIIFAYLGLLYFENSPNSLKEVTYASKSVCGGVLYKP